MSHNCSFGCSFDNDRSREHLLHHIKNNIPTKIYAHERELLPCRDDFIEDHYNAAVEKIINGHTSLPFNPTVYEELNNFVNCDNCDDCHNGKRCRRKTKRYQILCFGTLPDGSRAAVVLTDIDVYADVDRDPSETHARHENIEELMGYPFKGFSHTPRKYYRVHFTCLSDRSDFIRWAHNQKIGTYSDDRNYLNLVLRTHPIASSGWNILAGSKGGDLGYRVIDDETISNVRYKFSIPIAGMSRMRKRMISSMIDKKHILTPLIDKTRKLVACWDIETYTSVQMDVPQPSDEGWNIFTLSTSFGWYGSNKALFDVSLVDVELDVYQHADANADACATPRIMEPTHKEHMNPGIVIVCKHEKEILEMFAHIEALMNPDIRAAFNGGNFDWPMVLEKVKRNEKTSPGFLMQFYRNISGRNYHSDGPENTLKYKFRDRNVKIDAETQHNMSVVCGAPGCLDTDCHVVFKKLYPRAEVGLNASLNYYLAANGLESKVDLDYVTMFKYYENARAGLPCARQQMLKVVYYCLIDAKSIARLYNKRTIIGDAINLAKISATPLFDSFYTADGSRVTNTVGKYTPYFHEFYSATVASDVPKVKYTGAKVIKPIRGVCKFPVVGDDFASMYPHMHINYNISTDMIVTDPQYAAQLRDMGYNIYYSGLMDCEERDTGRKFQIHAWFVRHNEVMNIKKINDLSSDTVAYPDNEAKITTAFVKVTTVTFASGDKWAYEHPINMDIQELAEEPLKPALTYDKYIDDPDALIAAAASALGKPAEQLGKIDSRKYTYKNVYGRKRLQREHIGVFGYILKKLFDKRVPVKNAYRNLLDIEEKMTKERLETCEFVHQGRTVNWDLAEVQFNIAKLESLQKAIKVLCNTFYGTSGFNKSPIYMLEIASTVTSKGRLVLTIAEQLTIHYGHTVVYGDTDSIYMHVNPKYFEAHIQKCQDAERENLSALEFGEITPAEYEKRRRAALYDLWSAMIMITIEMATRLLEHTSDYMVGRTGSLRFTMAFEEVLAVFVSCGRKKYFGTPHIKDVNFDSKAFIRGLEFIKQGATELAKELGMAVVNQLRSIYNTKSAEDIVFEQINRLYKDSWDQKYFVSYSKYKPNKDNVRVKRFHARMVEINEAFLEVGDHNMAQLFKPPHPAAKFAYLVVEREDGMTITGAVKRASAGDKMEYVSVYNYFKEQYRECPYPNNAYMVNLYDVYNRLEIDMVHYLNKSLATTLARFIAHEDEFAPEGIDADEDYGAYDKATIKAASAKIIAYADKMRARASSARFAVRKAEFRKIKSDVNAALKVRHGGAVVKVLGAYTPKSARVGDTVAKVEEMCNAVAEKNAEGTCNYADYVREYINVNGGDVRKARRAFERASEVYRAHNDVRKNACLNKLRGMDKAMVESVHAYYNSLLLGEDSQINIEEWAECINTVVNIKTYEIIRAGIRAEFERVDDEAHSIIDEAYVMRAVMDRLNKV